jgi:hypothetical protein
VTGSTRATGGRGTCIAARAAADAAPSGQAGRVQQAAAASSVRRFKGEADALCIGLWRAV